MKEIQDGYQNEFYFVLEFNNKRIKELNPMLREVIDDLYPNFNDESIIKSWRNHINIEKGDIILKINNCIRSISVKKGMRNSIHLESIYSFKNFLDDLGIDKNIINMYENFHYGKFQNTIISGEEYKKRFKNEIMIINEAFSTININKVIDRFILKGKISKYPIDGIIYGTPKDFFWIKKDDIIEIINKSLNTTSNGIHIGCLFIQPLNRCLNQNTKYLKYRDYVQVKWYSIFDDIIRFKNDKLQ